MSESLSKFGLIGIVLLVAIVAILGGSYATRQLPLGSASIGNPANVATTTNVALTAATAANIIATSTCTARIITTSGSAVMLTFSDKQGQTPTGSFGFLQAASTTVVYDSGLYGCGLVKATSFATQLVTVSDVR